jgi:hypothetical protein
MADITRLVSQVEVDGYDLGLVGGGQDREPPKDCVCKERVWVNECVFDLSSNAGFLRCLLWMFLPEFSA